MRDWERSGEWATGGRTKNILGAFSSFLNLFKTQLAFNIKIVTMCCEFIAYVEVKYMPLCAVNVIYLEGG